MTEIPPVQLPLRVSLRDSYTFDNYLAGNNGLTKDSLSNVLQQNGFQFVYLWGAANSGKSHLLQACCAQASIEGDTVSYIPCQELISHGSEVLEGLEQLQLVCLDDIHVFAGIDEWEQALFALFNALKDRDVKFIVSSQLNIVEAGFKLADLQSRLQWGLNLRLLMLTDEQKVEALMLYCESGRININVEVVNWLIKHVSRDMGSLYKCMELIVEQAISQQRRITIPFVKTLL